MSYIFTLYVVEWRLLTFKYVTDIQNTADVLEQIIEHANSVKFGYISESNFSLSAPSHGSILCTGIHLPEETVEVKSGVCCRRLQNFIIHPFSWFYWIFSVFMCFFGVLSGWLIMYQVHYTYSTIHIKIRFPC